MRPFFARPWWPLLLLMFLPSWGRAQDFRVLRDPRPLDPNANASPASLPEGVAAPRVLLAGDSWAQYMWDDGSHNDVFDRFGHAEKLALSLSLSEDPGPGYTGPEYAVSGSEARQWADTLAYPWIANVVAALEAEPTIDAVVLSIGGNDILAGKSDGGWYKDMDLDVPGSEAALFERIRIDTFRIIDAALAVRPGLEVLLASYDYPNFNVPGLLCLLYACPKRRDLSRDPDNDLVTDAELNAMMVAVESSRIAWTNSAERVRYDNSTGLMHHFYGDGVSPPGALPRPGQVPPDYLPFPGGNPSLPTLRENFRVPGIDVDPIHLDYEGYQYKIVQQTEGYFLPEFRGDATETFFSQGGTGDGWTDGSSAGSAGIVIGDNGAGLVYGIVSFDTAALPDAADVTGARFYLTRESVSGGNPFSTGDLGIPRVDVVSGSFGAPGVEASDAFASADVVDAGYLAGSAKADGYAVGVEIASAALSAINSQGLTQFRLYFPAPGGGAGADAVTFSDGDAASPPGGFPTLAAYMGTAAPFLDVTYSVPVGVEDEALADAWPRLLANSPNPFTRSTSIRFLLSEPTHVRINVYDVRGRLVATLAEGLFPEGSNAVTWNGRDRAASRMAPGVYLVELRAGNRSRARKVVLAD